MRELKVVVAKGLYLVLRQCFMTHFVALKHLATREYCAVYIKGRLDTKRSTACSVCGLYFLLVWHS